MVLATSALRNLWAPACGRKGRTYTAAYRALDTVMHRHDYHPRPGVTGAYNCRKITGGSGYSLHAYGVGDIFTFWTGVRCATSLAVDINWDTNPYGPRLVTDMPRPMIDDIQAIRTNSGAQVWRWGGYYRGNKDAMHFEIVCSPSDLATGIDPATVRSATPDAAPQEDDIVFTVAEAGAYVDEAYALIAGRPPTDYEKWIWAHAIAEDPREMWKMQQRLTGEALKAARAS